MNLKATIIVFKRVISTYMTLLKIFEENIYLFVRILLKYVSQFVVKNLIILLDYK
jgi:hypothetical protein